MINGTLVFNETWYVFAVFTYLGQCLCHLWLQGCRAKASLQVSVLTRYLMNC